MRKNGKIVNLSGIGAVTAAAVAAAALLAGRPAAAATTTASFTGSYTDNFNDLPTVSASVNTGSFTINSGGATTTAITTPTDSLETDFSLANANGTGAWYGGTSAAALKVGAHPGDQTTGGVIDFGANSSTADDRALGALATSTNGDTTFGVELVNNTAAPISSINVSFLGEKFRDGKTAGVTKNLNFAYLQVPAASVGTSTLPVSAATAGLTQVPGLSFTTMTTGGNGAVTPPTQFPQSGTVALSTPWNVGDGLWLTWQMPGNTGSGDGLAIDNLSVSSVPEPTTLSLLGLGGAALVARRRKMR